LLHDSQTGRLAYLRLPTTWPCCFRSNTWAARGKDTLKSMMHVRFGSKATFAPQRSCPLYWVKSRHVHCTSRCLLYPQKRTFRSALELSARANSDTNKLGLGCCCKLKARSHGPAVGGTDRTPYRGAGDLLRSST